MVQTKIFVVPFHVLIIKIPFPLGVETMKQMFNLIDHKKYFGIGTNPKTMIPLVKFFLKDLLEKWIIFIL